MFSTASVVPLLGAISILVLTVELLRRRQLREKYAALWLLVSAVAVVLAAFPGLLDWLSESLGFGVPVNLLFFVGFLVLLFVAMQLSLETGRREDETERLAEEVALLRRAVAELESAVQRLDHGGPASSPQR
jgi:hypothetical protein